MVVKALAVGSALILATLFSPAYANDGNGRYTIVPLPGRHVLILLDTKTGHNWLLDLMNVGGKKEAVWTPNQFPAVRDILGRYRPWVLPAPTQK